MLSLLINDFPKHLTPDEMAQNLRAIQDAINGITAREGNDVVRKVYNVLQAGPYFFHEDLIKTVIIGIERNNINADFTQITEEGSNKWKILFDTDLAVGETLFIKYRKIPTADQTPDLE